MTRLNILIVTAGCAVMAGLYLNLEPAGTEIQGQTRPAAVKLTLSPNTKEHALGVSGSLEGDEDAAIFKISRRNFHSTVIGRIETATDSLVTFVERPIGNYPVKFKPRRLHFVKLPRQHKDAPQKWICEDCGEVIYKKGQAANWEGSSA